MSEQQPEVQPGTGSDTAEQNGFADAARAAADEPASSLAQDPTQPADEASSPA